MLFDEFFVSNRISMPNWKAKDSIELLQLRKVTGSAYQSMNVQLCFWASSRFLTLYLGRTWPFKEYVTDHVLDKISFQLPNE